MILSQAADGVGRQMGGSEGCAERRENRAGSVLLLVLVVVAVLSLGTATYLNLMQTELRAVRQHGRALQARQHAQSAIEYLKTTLMLTPADIAAQGGVANNPAVMQGLLVDEQPGDFDRGRFTVLAPTQVDGRYSGLRYGLENESAKLNLNVLLAEGVQDQASARLMALPSMTADIADAILDWIDPDDSPRPLGAEAEAYQQADPPYTPRNGPLATIDELLLVRGVTPELLYGIDQNRNGLVDAGETSQGALVQIDNTYGVMNRGWSAYLTITSVEAPRGGLAGAVDINGGQLQTLYDGLKSAVGDAEAKFVIAYRQHGASGAQNDAGDDAGEQAGSGSSESAGDRGGRSRSRDESRGRGRGRGGGEQQGQGQNNAPPATRISAGAIQLNFERQPARQLNSLLDLVGVEVQIPGQNENAPPQLVESPWPDAPSGYRDLLDLYDRVALGAAGRIGGRVNINAASRAVLRSVPGLSATAINQIVARRELEPDPVASEQRHPLWILIHGIVTLEEMRVLEPYITAGGDAFSCQAAGFFDEGPTVARFEVILDRSDKTPRLRAMRDLSRWGPGFTPTLLGAQSTGTP